LTARPRTDTRWWGWGDPDRGTSLSQTVRNLLDQRGIKTESQEQVPDIGDVAIPDPVDLPPSITDKIDPSRFFVDHESRIRHSGGQAIADLTERRNGRIGNLPDAVFVPGDSAEIELFLEACDVEGIAVVPFGGGTSVVGGVRPETGPHRAVVALDTAALRGFELDRESGTARLGAGLRGAEAEALLNREGLTLGHFPQSFEYATIGGFAATRSAGQASAGYGRFDQMVTSIELISPVGSIRTLKTPHTSAGPSVLEMILGSEGTLGVIPWVEVAVTERPRITAWEGWLAPDFETGCDLARKWAQQNVELAVLRVSDLHETAVALERTRPPGLPGRAFEGYLGLRGVRSGSLVIIGIEGDRERVRSVRQRVRRDLRAESAVSLGQSVGQSWAADRFDGPYLREGLMDQGLLVETLESSASWRDYGDAYREVRQTIEGTLDEMGSSSVVMCHLSHTYRDGASLYFTVIADCPDRDPAETWAEVKTAALGRITELGLTVSHHHATGRDHAPFISAEAGEAGMAALRALKESLDPRGIMNPGCLLPN
jgi:alkyldihydroxyacetonephosphate synthase